MGFVYARILFMRPYMTRYFLAMLTLNEGRYIANLTDSPVLTKTINGDDVVNFRVAINGNGKTKDSDAATFVDVEAYGGLARLCYNKIDAGSLVLIQAKLKSVDWDDGNKSKVFLRADNIQFLDFTQK